MLVTDIKDIDSKKCLVYIDYEKAFALYKTEIKKYNISVHKEILDSTYFVIVNEVLQKRCGERAGYILERADKSVRELRTRLSQSYYPECVIDTVIDEFIRYGYLDDRRFADNYVRYNVRKKSKDRIINELLQKGIHKELIEEAFINYEGDDTNSSLKDIQEHLIVKEFEKKKYDFDEEDRVKLSKITASLMRKGFSYDNIMHVYHKMKRE